MKKERIRRPKNCIKSNVTRYVMGAVHIRCGFSQAREHITHTNIKHIADDNNLRELVTFHVNSSRLVLCLPLIGRKPKQRSEI